MADIHHRNQSHQPYTLPGGSDTQNELEPKPDIETSSATSFVSATDQQPDIPTTMIHHRSRKRLWISSMAVGHDDPDADHYQPFENWTLPKRFWNNSPNDLEVITFQWIYIAETFSDVWLSLGALATVPFHYHLVDQREYIKGKL
ncbi:hypothetical protein CDV31_005334 [Fusarium ambrosium]|uniref:Uncharacterized protein n=1 Tax=Fusarium ambrosium TaxID=131363 RepID=A0A428UKL2_9HYPO|nr:hypothetical protein CDV31_005334 [Fusarium ambrosium]